MTSVELIPDLLGEPNQVADTVVLEPAPLEAVQLLAEGFAQRIKLLAQQLGASAQAARVTALAAAEISRANAHGHVCIALDALAERLGEPPSAVQRWLFSSGLVSAGQVADIELLPLVLDSGGRLYLARYYAYERRIAHVLAALASAGRLTVVSGGPGTGKTTAMVSQLVSLLETNSALRIVLAAPTGKAAQRMLAALSERASHLPAAIKQHLPEQSFTLHRLLGANRQPNAQSTAALPYDVIVVDEASMIDVALAAQLVDALASHSRLILLGDKDQLAAVEAGAVFAELSVSKALTDCVSRLEHNYRFGLESAIGRLSLAIRAGSPSEALASLILESPAHVPFSLGSSSAAAVLIDDDSEALTARSLDCVAQGFGPYATALKDLLHGLAKPQAKCDLGALFEALNHYRVLSAVRAGRRGIEALNAVLAARICAMANITVAQGAVWFAGRPVMITRNDYALGLFNGDTGIALPAAGNKFRVVFPTTDGGWRAVSPAVLPPHETAFALTVHKAQGSEFNQLAFVLPATAHSGLTRELVYTAITRARQTLAILGSPSVFEQAILTPTRRAAGLSARLEEAVLLQRD
ncbi:Exodeoxyribonuclease V, alpha subunit [Mycoavidus cysteinexigens]|uniref:RecBCD enzyme subunit RecD n=1 Tax=Mycoavidus cysteinexigens TaxID=1553431 RepID=A0A2Z6EV63_9BURK|nr:exodeoxyribonuclease V subunit alpha [Mycoavidus cysteinexigens]BBE08975.1 Exodeoxyribonuclease V, alpha subunit [Mycoavidus cysteinexigens]GAM52301.1 exodeoxyribonuclease V alpha chain [bacterium endosymbiont of Mortierella elongata FMR23-6]GLR01180.1 RecBCD enzyme subunit RecD [Mycoavidus cysteinexigens]